MSKEIKIAIVCLLAVFLVYFGLNYLKGAEVFSKSSNYYAIYDGVGGLTNDNAIMYNGLRIGRVKGVSFLKDRSGRQLVELSITEKNINIPSNSTAKITSLDLFGTKAVVLVPGSSPNEAAPGDTLRSGVESDLADALDARFRPIEEKTNKLISSLDSVVTSVQLIFDEETTLNLRESFVYINESFYEMREALKSVNEILSAERDHIEGAFSNLEDITQVVADNSDNISHTLENLATFSDTLANMKVQETLDATQKAMANLETITNKINAGEGTVGMLINNDSLYLNLEQASKDLDLLLLDMQENPKRYVHFSIFGKSEKKGEKKKEKSKETE